MAIRARGMGSVYLRGSTFWISYYAKGKKVRETSHSHSEARAVALLKQRLAEISRGVYVAGSQRVYFEDLREMVFSDYTLKNRKSTERARRSFKKLAPAFAGQRAVNITADQIARYASDRRAMGAALATVSLELSALKRGFTLAIKHGRLAIRPAFPDIDVQNARQGFFERSEYEAIRDQLPEDYRVLVTTAFWCGLRRGELLGLEWRNVDLDAHIIRLEPGTTKSGDGRTIPYGAVQELVDALAEQRRRVEDYQRATGCVLVHVFVHLGGARAGQPIHTYNVVWRAARERAGLPNRLVHDCRRSFIRRLEQSGVARSVGMKLSGHRTEDVYRRYAIVRESDLAPAMERAARGPAERKVLPMGAKTGTNDGHPPDKGDPA